MILGYQTLVSDPDGYAVLILQERQSRPWWIPAFFWEDRFGVRLTRMEAIVLAQSLHKLAQDRAVGSGFGEGA